MASHSTIMTSRNHSENVGGNGSFSMIQNNLSHGELGTSTIQRFDGEAKGMKWLATVMSFPPMPTGYFNPDGRPYFRSKL
jgi:hypothetical protein